LDHRGAQPNDYCLGTFVLNENVKPAQMDLTISESSDAKIVGKTMPVIYELNGND
jgi:hypothetical protein